MGGASIPCIPHCIQTQNRYQYLPTCNPLSIAFYLEKLNIFVHLLYSGKTGNTTFFELLLLFSLWIGCNNMKICRIMYCCLECSDCWKCVFACKVVCENRSRVDTRQPRSRWHLSNIQCWELEARSASQCWPSLSSLYMLLLSTLRSTQYPLSSFYYQVTYFHLN